MWMERVVCCEVDKANEKGKGTTCPTESLRRRVQDKDEREGKAEAERGQQLTRQQKRRREVKRYKRRCRNRALRESAAAAIAAEIEKQQQQEDEEKEKTFELGSAGDASPMNEDETTKRKGEEVLCDGAEKKRQQLELQQENYANGDEESNYSNEHDNSHSQQCNNNTNTNHNNNNHVVNNELQMMCVMSSAPVTATMSYMIDKTSRSSFSCGKQEEERVKIILKEQHKKREEQVVSDNGGSGGMRYVDPLCFPRGIMSTTRSRTPSFSSITTTTSSTSSLSPMTDQSGADRIQREEAHCGKERNGQRKGNNSKKEKESQESETRSKRELEEMRVVLHTTVKGSPPPCSSRPLPPPHVVFREENSSSSSFIPWEQPPPQQQYFPLPPPHPHYPPYPRHGLSSPSPFPSWSFSPPPLPRVVGRISIPRLFAPTPTAVGCREGGGAGGQRGAPSPCSSPPFSCSTRLPTEWGDGGGEGRPLLPPPPSDDSPSSTSEDEEYSYFHRWSGGTIRLLESSSALLRQREGEQELPRAMPPPTMGGERRNREDNSSSSFLLPLSSSSSGSRRAASAALPMFSPFPEGVALHLPPMNYMTVETTYRVYQFCPGFKRNVGAALFGLMELALNDLREVEQDGGSRRRKEDEERQEGDGAREVCAADQFPHDAAQPTPSSFTLFTMTSPAIRPVHQSHVLPHSSVSTGGVTLPKPQTTAVFPLLLLPPPLPKNEGQEEEPSSLSPQGEQEGRRQRIVERAEGTEPRDAESQQKGWLQGRPGSKENALLNLPSSLSTLQRSVHYVSSPVVRSTSASSGNTPPAPLSSSTPPPPLLVEGGSAGRRERHVRLLCTSEVLPMIFLLPVQHLKREQSPPSSSSQTKEREGGNGVEPPLRNVSSRVPLPRATPTKFTFSSLWKQGEKRTEEERKFFDDVDSEKKNRPQGGIPMESVFSSSLSPSPSSSSSSSAWIIFIHPVSSDLIVLSSDVATSNTKHSFSTPLTTGGGSSPTTTTTTSTSSSSFPTPPAPFSSFPSFSCELARYPSSLRREEAGITPPYAPAATPLKGSAECSGALVRLAQSFPALLSSSSSAPCSFSSSASSARSREYTSPETLREKSLRAKLLYHLLHVAHERLSERKGNEEGEEEESNVQGISGFPSPPPAISSVSSFSLLTDSHQKTRTSFVVPPCPSLPLSPSPTPTPSPPLLLLNSPSASSSSLPPLSPPLLLTYTSHPNNPVRTLPPPPPPHTSASTTATAHPVLTPAASTGEGAGSLLPSPPPPPPSPLSCLFHSYHRNVAFDIAACGGALEEEAQTCAGSMMMTNLMKMMWGGKQEALPLGNESRSRERGQAPMRATNRPHMSKVRTAAMTGAHSSSSPSFPPVRLTAYTGVESPIVWDVKNRRESLLKVMDVQLLSSLSLFSSSSSFSCSTSTSSSYSLASSRARKTMTGTSRVSPFPSPLPPPPALLPCSSPRHPPLLLPSSPALPASPRHFPSSSFPNSSCQTPRTPSGRNPHQPNGTSEADWYAKWMKEQEEKGNSVVRRDDALIIPYSSFSCSFMPSPSFTPSGPPPPPPPPPSPPLPVWSPFLSSLECILSLWFEAFLSRVPQVSIYTHRNGVLQPSFLRVQMEQLQTHVYPEALDACMTFTCRVLRYIQAHCTLIGATYALMYHDGGRPEVELVLLSTAPVLLPASGVSYFSPPFTPSTGKG